MKRDEESISCYPVQNRPRGLLGLGLQMVRIMTKYDAAKSLKEIAEIKFVNVKSFRFSF